MNSDHVLHDFYKEKDENMVYPDEKPITIRGLVIPVDWDEKGNVVGVAISTFDENEYLVDRDEESEGLLSIIREEVQVSGIFREEKGKKRFRVKPSII